MISSRALSLVVHSICEIDVAVLDLNFEGGGASSPLREEIVLCC